MIAAVITPARVRQRLNDRPFRPFRLFLSDGSHHDVPHPEFAWVWGNRVFVGLASRNGGPDMKELSILHLTRIEDLRERRTKR